MDIIIGGLIMILKVANNSMLTGEGFIEIKKEIVFKKTGAYLLPGGQDSYWYQRERMPKL